MAVSIKMQDDFTGTNIDTSKWDETDPQGVISQNGNLQINYGAHQNTTLFADKLQSDTSVTSGVAVVQSTINFGSEGGSNATVYGMYLYVDDNNYAVIQSRSNNSDKFRLRVVDGGVTAYDFDTNVGWPNPAKITYDIAGGDVKFWYWNGSAWTQLGSTQTGITLGSSVKIVYSYDDDAGFDSTNNATFDDAYLVQGDYSVNPPVNVDDTTFLDTSSKFW